MFLGLNAIPFMIGSCLESRVAGATVSISPFMVLFAVFFFQSLWGFFDAFIGVALLIAGATLLAWHDGTRLDRHAGDGATPVGRVAPGLATRRRTHLSPTSRHEPGGFA